MHPGWKVFILGAAVGAGMVLAGIAFVRGEFFWGGFLFALALAAYWPGATSAERLR